MGIQKRNSIQHSLYDPAVVAAICQCFDLAPPIVTGPSRTVQLDELQPGHVLAENLQTLDGMLILSSGTKITSLLLQRIQNFHDLKSISNIILVCP